MASSEGLNRVSGRPYRPDTSSKPDVLMQVTMAPPLTTVKEGCLLKKLFQETIFR